MSGPCAFAAFVRSVAPYPPQFWVMIWTPPLRSALPQGSGEWGTHSCTQLSVRANPAPPPPPWAPPDPETVPRPPGKGRALGDPSMGGPPPPTESQEAEDAMTRWKRERRAARLVGHSRHEDIRRRVFMARPPGTTRADYC